MVGANRPATKRAARCEAIGVAAAVDDEVGAAVGRSHVGCGTQGFAADGWRSCSRPRGLACRPMSRRSRPDHPDRDAQFAYLNDQATDHLATGDPVISVDTKKKELVGAYKNGGQEWQPKGKPEQVKVHDFIDPRWQGQRTGLRRGANIGWVSVARTTRGRGIRIN